jgi:hypothetical protein
MLRIVGAAQSLSDGDRGEVGVAFGQIGHHGRIDNPKGLIAAHRALGVDNGPTVVGAAHPAGADHVDMVADHRWQPPLYRLVTIQLPECAVWNDHFLGDGQHRRSLDDLNHAAHGVTEANQVPFVGQSMAVHDRTVMGIIRSKAELAGGEHSRRRHAVRVAQGRPDLVLALFLEDAGLYARDSDGMDVSGFGEQFPLAEQAVRAGRTPGGGGASRSAPNTCSPTPRRPRNASMAASTCLASARYEARPPSSPT